MELTWWATTWGKVEPGDFVQAPDGSTWEVRGALEDESGTEYVIGRPGEATWASTTPDPGAPVHAARPDRGRVSAAEELSAIGALIGAFPGLTPSRG